MLDAPLAPYLLWAKTRQPAAIDLAGSNLLPCTIDDVPGAREAMDITAPNDNGYPPLLSAIARHYGVTEDRIVTGHGCSGANFLTIAALVGPGDEVLVERPAYDPLLGACALMGARIERFDRRFADAWRIDLDAIRARLTPRTRLIIVTSPHNPTGVVIETETLRGLGRVAADAGAHVLVDEVYLDGANGLAGRVRAPAAATLDGPFISTSSLTKSYGLAGLRCGWAVSAPAIAARLRRTRDVVDNAESAPADRLAAHAFGQLPALARRATTLLAGNVARARDFFAAHPELEIVEPPSTSVVFPRLLGLTDATPFVRRLLETHGVAVAPGHFFDAPAHFRISLAGRPEVLAAGLTRLSEALA
ncbi:MAG TPA: pyridoxal phosphate-dependent aminotransferase [Vicinamibacterales bacterium]|nr:pyridoxal phosphate-dependent aminotransferase [Vicinamibacterales bacterium]